MSKIITKNINFKNTQIGDKNKSQVSQSLLRHYELC